MSIVIPRERRRAGGLEMQFSGSSRLESTPLLLQRAQALRRFVDRSAVGGVPQLRSLCLDAERRSVGAGAGQTMRDATNNVQVATLESLFQIA